jgi:hypothetical protein
MRCQVMSMEKLAQKGFRASSEEGAEKRNSCSIGAFVKLSTSEGRRTTQTKDIMENVRFAQLTPHLRICNPKLS